MVKVLCYKSEGRCFDPIPGPSSGGMDVTQLYMGRKVCQPCTLVQCEVRGQGMYAKCTSLVYERVVDRKAQWCRGVIMFLVL